MLDIRNCETHCRCCTISCRTISPGVRKSLLGKRLEPLPFNGWPRKRRKSFRAENWNARQIVKETFLPSRWWLGVYYGATNWLGSLHILLWQHPKSIFWWGKLQNERPHKTGGRFSWSGRARRGADNRRPASITHKRKRGQPFQSISKIDTTRSHPYILPI